MDAIWLLSLSLAGGALVPGAPAVTLGVLGVAAALVALRGRRALAIALLALVAVGALRASRAISRHATAERAAPRALAGAPRLVRCSVTGSVATSPTRATGASGGTTADASVRLAIEEVTLTCEGENAAQPTALAGRVVLHVPWAEGEALRRGDRVEAFASLAPPQRFVVPELGDDRASRAHGGVVLSGGAVDLVRLAEGRGPRAWIDEARRHVRARILATFPPRAEALARALVLGENDLAPDDARDFRDGGLSHLLAVSGMHLVLTVNGAVLALTALFCRVRWLALRVVPRRLASLVGLVICWIYCDFSGSSGSAVRAAWMLSVQLLAAALGRRVRPLRALGWSVLVMALVEPLVAVDVSFALSAAATLGLIGHASLSGRLGPRLSTHLARAPAPARYVGQSLATTLAATAPCAPILLRMGPALSLGSLLANVIAVPLGEAAALPICLTHALLAPLPRAERGAALAGGGALLLVGRLAHLTATSRLGRVALPRPTDTQLGFLVLLAFAGTGAARAGSSRGTGASAARAARLRSLQRAAQVSALAGLALAEVHARRTGAPRGALRVTFLDVGQGDSALIDLPSGEAVLIDAGGLVGSAVDPGERVVAPLLRARRRSALAAVMVSHPHPDHFMGLRAGLEAVRVGEVWDTGEARATAPNARPGPYGATAYVALLGELEARGARVRRPDTLCGTHEIGGAEVTVLAPCPAFAEDRGTNDNSLVLRVRFGDRAFLFVGDAEHAEEGLLLQRAADAAGSLRADVLKVGHHGSRTSSGDALLDAVAPHLAVASCGGRNRYGHPHPVTTERFRGRGIALLRTDCLGTVSVRTDGRSLEVAATAGDGPCL